MRVSSILGPALYAAVGACTIDGTFPEASGDAGRDGGAGGPTVYPSDRTQSPLTEAVAARLRKVAAAAPRREDVVAKVGDSITVSNQFLHCFADGPPPTLPGELEATRAHIAAADVGGTSPFDRASLAAGVGWSLDTLLGGAPSALARELDAIEPRYAVIMYGTNDLEGRDPAGFGVRLLAAVDQLIAGGTIPVVSTIPPRQWNDRDALVPIFNAVIRAVAQRRQVPLVDLHRELVGVVGFGLGEDGLHPSSTGGGCDFSAEGLTAGYNVRNLVTLGGLDRARRALAGEAAPDAAAVALEGSGSTAEPYLVPGLPFVDGRPSGEGGERRLSAYACSPQSDESGPEHLYRLEAAAATRVHAVVIDGDGVDVDVHLLAGEPSAAACVARHDREITVDLGPGIHYIAVDTYVAGGVEQVGDYLLAVAAE